eukprot:309230-Prorocentrum_minimum.AAC.2
MAGPAAAEGLRSASLKGHPTSPLPRSSSARFIRTHASLSPSPFLDRAVSPPPATAAAASGAPPAVNGLLPGAAPCLEEEPPERSPLHLDSFFSSRRTSGVLRPCDGRPSGCGSRSKGNLSGPNARSSGPNPEAAPTPPASPSLPSGGKAARSFFSPLAPLSLESRSLLESARSARSACGSNVAGDECAGFMESKDPREEEEVCALRPLVTSRLRSLMPSTVDGFPCKDPTTHHQQLDGPSKVW